SYIKFVLIIYLSNVAIRAALTYANTSCVLAINFPAIYAIKMNDRMNPNVGVMIVIGPPLNCAKTGAPTNPSIMYTNMEKAPSLLPNTRPANIAKKVCSVIGTPPTDKPGIILVILAPIAVNATNKLPSIKLRGVNWLFFILSSYFLPILLLVKNNCRLS